MLSTLLGTQAQSGLPGPLDSFWYEESPGTIAGQNVTPETAIRVAAVMACVRVIAESLASVPLILYQRTEGGGKERASGEPLFTLLHDQPNRWQTSFEFIEQMTAALALRGNAYAEIFMRRGEIEELVPIHPSRVTVEKLTNGVLRYVVKDEETMRDRTIPQSQMFHLRGISFDGIQGLSTIGLHRLTLANQMAMEEQSTRMYEHGIQHSGTIEHPGPKPLSDKAYLRLKASFDEHTGVRNWWKPRILEEGMKWNSTSMTAEDAQFIESRKFGVEEIARIFRVPPHMIQDLTHATFSNIEHQSIDFVVHTMRPWACRWEKAIRRDLLLEPDDFMAEFLLDGLQRGDTNSRYGAYAIGVQNEWLTRNEVRRLENLNPVPGGDEFRNPITSPKQQDEAVEPAESPDARLRRSLVADMAKRIASAEHREISKRAAKAADDRERFNAWVAAFFEKHRSYVSGVLQPLADAGWLAEAEVVEVITKPPVERLSVGVVESLSDSWLADRIEEIATYIDVAIEENKQ